MSDKTLSLEATWFPIHGSSIIATNAKATQCAHFFGGGNKYTSFFSPVAKQCFIVLKSVKYADGTIRDIDPSNWLVYKFEGEPHNVSDEKAVMRCITIGNYVGNYVGEYIANGKIEYIA